MNKKTYHLGFLHSPPFIVPLICSDVSGDENPHLFDEKWDSIFEYFGVGFCDGCIDASNPKEAFEAVARNYRLKLQNVEFLRWAKQ